MELWRRRVGLEITVLPRATFPVSNGNNIVACNFARFATNNVKGRQVATVYEASCLWQQHKLNVKTYLPNFRRALLSW